MTILAEMALNADRFGHFDQYSAEVQIALALPKLGYTSVDILACQVVRAYANRLVKEIFSQVDVIVTPTAPTTAPFIDPAYLTHGLSDIALSVHLMRFILLGNLVGVPSVAVPMGYAPKDEVDLPTSMLVQADHWNEHVALHVARAIESISPVKQPQAYHYDIIKAAEDILHQQN
jgi:aspartyl-tRNA(Asn)/glutamyl-tRNA(Gln) amidotransferase subunit A